MRYEEERLAAAAEQLKTFSATITAKPALADLAVIIASFETMRPYVCVGLKVSPSCEALAAIDRLHQREIVPPQLWNTLMAAVDSARNPNLVPAVPQAEIKPCRRVGSRLMRRSLSFRANRLNRRS